MRHSLHRTTALEIQVTTTIERVASGSLIALSIPTLILSADDDPFVPVEQFTNDALRSNPAVTVIVTHGGGHCGFFTNPDADFDGYWAEQTAVVFSEQHL